MSQLCVVFAAASSFPSASFPVQQRSSKAELGCFIASANDAFVVKAGQGTAWASHFNTRPQQSSFTHTLPFWTHLSYVRHSVMLCSLECIGGHGVPSMITAATMALSGAARTASSWSLSCKYQVGGPTFKPHSRAQQHLPLADSLTYKLT